MNGRHITAAEAKRLLRPWGSIARLFDAASLGSAAGLTLSLATYDAPHHSGTHPDHELIFVLAGRGTARLAGREISFGPESLLAIPRGTEHEIAAITRGPVRAALIHFK